MTTEARPYIPLSDEDVRVRFNELILSQWALGRRGDPAPGPVATEPLATTAHSEMIEVCRFYNHESFAPEGRNVASRMVPRAWGRLPALVDDAVWLSSDRGAANFNRAMKRIGRPSVFTARRGEQARVVGSEARELFGSFEEDPPPLIIGPPRSARWVVAHEHTANTAPYAVAGQEVLATKPSRLRRAGAAVLRHVFGR
jgi:hypothetical protein